MFGLGESANGSTPETVSPAGPRTGVTARSPHDVPGLVTNVWSQHEQGPKFPVLSEDLDANVCIIGAGITGLSIAYNLADTLGDRLVVLEGRVRGGGMSGRCHGMLMKWNDDSFSNLINEYGLDTVKELAEGHREAIDWVEAVVNKENIKCGFSRVDGYLIPHDESPEALMGIASEWQSGLKLGLLDVEKVELSGRAADARVKDALKIPGNAELDPVAYINGLADAVAAKGVRIYEMSRVLSALANKVTVNTGATVKAGVVIHASGTPLSQNLAIHSRQRPWRHYMISMSLTTTGLVNRAQYYDTSRHAKGVEGRPDAMYYARFCPQPSGPEVLLVGGCHHPLGQTSKQYKDYYADLEQWARSRFTMAKDVLHKWSIQTYEPVDHLPLIGMDPLNPYKTYYVATGDSGQHLTFNTLAGLLISDMIKGRISPYKNIFDTARRWPVQDWRQTLTEVGYLGTIARKFVSRIAPRSFSELKGLIYLGQDIEDLGKGQGTVCQKGLHKVAVYKDEKGECHEHSAVCTHMGCLLSWNPVDKSFDCACHGSAYDGYGHSISGPSRCDLKPAEGFSLV